MAVTKILKGAVPAGNANLAAPAFVDQVKDGVGRSAGSHSVGVIDQNALPARDSNPTTVVVASGRSNKIECCWRQLRKIVIEETHCAGTLG